MFVGSVHSIDPTIRLQEVRYLSIVQWDALSRAAEVYDLRRTRSALLAAQTTNAKYPAKLIAELNVMEDAIMERRVPNDLDRAEAEVAALYGPASSATPLTMEGVQYEDHRPQPEVL